MAVAPPIAGAPPTPVAPPTAVAPPIPARVPLLEQAVMTTRIPVAKNARARSMGSRFYQACRETIVRRLLTWGTSLREQADVLTSPWTMPLTMPFDKCTKTDVPRRLPVCRPPHQDATTRAGSPTRARAVEGWHRGRKAAGGRRHLPGGLREAVSAQGVRVLKGHGADERMCGRIVVAVHTVGADAQAERDDMVATPHLLGAGFQARRHILGGAVEPRRTKLTDLAQFAAALDRCGRRVGVRSAIHADRPVVRAHLRSASEPWLAASAVALVDHAGRTDPRAADTGAGAQPAAASDAGPRRSALNAVDGKILASRIVRHIAVDGPVLLCGAADKGQRGETPQDEPMNATAHPASASKPSADLQRRRGHGRPPTTSRRPCHAHAPPRVGPLRRARCRRAFAVPERASRAGPSNRRCSFAAPAPSRAILGGGLVGEGCPPPRLSDPIGT